STYLHDLAGFHHGLAQQSRQAGARTRELQTARRWYEEIVRSFPQAEDIARDHFLLAEVAFELQDFVAARDHYETVAYQYPADEQRSEEQTSELQSREKLVCRLLLEKKKLYT